MARALAAGTAVNLGESAAHGTGGSFRVPRTGDGAPLLPVAAQGGAVRWRELGTKEEANLPETRSP